MKIKKGKNACIKFFKFQTSKDKFKNLKRKWTHLLHQIITAMFPETVEKGGSK